MSVISNKNNAFEKLNPLRVALNFFLADCIYHSVNE